MLAVCLSLWLGSWSGSAAADDLQAYELAKSRYESGRYEEAVELLHKLLATPIDPADPRADQQRALYQRARPIYAAASVALGREEDADAMILEQLREDPFYELPPGQFPDAVSDRFIAVEAAHRAELERLKQQLLKKKQADIQQQEELRRLREARVAELEKLASETIVTERRSRLIAALPFGAGQFQNGDIGLGVFFAVSQTLTIAASLATGIAYFDRRDIALRACTGPTPRELNLEAGGCSQLDSQLQALRAANWVSFGSALALMAAGIIEAQVSFVPEVVSKETRPVPPPVKDPPPPVTVEPIAGPTQTGFFLGVQGRF